MFFFFLFFFGGGVFVWVGTCIRIQTKDLCDQKRYQKHVKRLKISDVPPTHENNKQAH